MFYEFVTIKHIKNFTKYGVGTMFEKRRFAKNLRYCLALFGTWYDDNSRESL
jgi:hypothetical protein